MLAPLPPLQAPFWERQPSESEAEFSAFREWLCGSPRGELRDWLHAAHVTGLAPDDLRALAQRWVWEVRANEYTRQATRAGETALAPLREAVARLQARRLDYAWSMVDLIATELAKHLALAQSSSAITVDLGALARHARVFELAIQALQRQAEGLPPEADQATTEALDWSALTPAELELHRQLRAKAARRAG